MLEILVEGHSPISLFVINSYLHVIEISVVAELGGIIHTETNVAQSDYSRIIGIGVDKHIVDIGHYLLALYLELYMTLLAEDIVFRERRHLHIAVLRAQSIIVDMMAHYGARTVIGIDLLHKICARTGGGKHYACIVSHERHVGLYGIMKVGSLFLPCVD